MQNLLEKVKSFYADTETGHVKLQQVGTLMSMTLKGKRGPPKTSSATTLKTVKQARELAERIVHHSA